MKFDQTDINNSIQEVVDKWNFSGHFVLLNKGDSLHNKCYGYENREKNVGTTEDTRYLMDSQHDFFVKFSILMEASKKHIKLKDKINQYIPELKQGEKITIKHLLNGESGLSDYYHSHLMVQFETDEQLSQLPEHDRVRKEYSIKYENRAFDTVLEIVNDKDLEFEPGKDDEYSSTESVILVELLKRLTGQTPFEYLKENVFDVLGMDSIQYGVETTALSYVEHNMRELVPTPVDFEVDGIFSVKAEDMIKLMHAILDKQFLTATVWKTALKRDKDGDCILFGNANGYDSVTIGFLGFAVAYYFDFENQVAYACISNEQQLFEFKDDIWLYYLKEFRNVVTAVLTFPKNTKMAKINKKNLWSALDITIKPEQNKFVLNAKSSVAMGLLYKTSHVYAQMEGNIVVGLLVLDIDKKKENYDIDIIIIDKKFQNKGYGKLMVKWAVDKLKEEGAKTLRIGVDRENVAAKKVYINAGFEPKSVYDGGMELEMKL